MAKKIITVGIAGQGRSGFDIHAAWLRQAPKQYKVVAVADQMPARRAQAKKEFGCRAYEDYKELIADGQFDLFVNSLPSNLHPKGTIAALRAGLNVVCEKPLATKLTDVDKVIAESRKARVMLAPFQNSRFSPFFVKTMAVIDSGVLGRILHVRLNASGFARRWDWQTRQELWGGNLNNTGPHPVDQAVMLFGEGKKKPQVFCRMFNGAGSSGDADDFCALTLYGKGSPVVEVLVSSYLAFPQGDQISISGEYGGLRGGAGELTWRYYDPAKAPKKKLLAGWSVDRAYCREQLTWTKKSWRLPKSKHQGFSRNSKGFYDNIYNVLAGKAKLVVTPAQVRCQIGVLEEAHRQNPLPKLPRRK